MALNSAVTDSKWSPNYSSGRPAGDPNVIVIHHWGADGQSHQGVVDYLCRANGDSSAHYVASAGRVTQLVHDYDRAWHAGPSGNPRGIGIECRPEMSDGDFATVAGLIRAIRAEWGDLPIRGHRDYMNTACPGRWYAQLANLDAAARGGSVAPTPTPTPAPSQPLTATDGQLVLDTDGIPGAATYSRFQQVMGTPIDGEIDDDDSPCIEAFQRFLNNNVSAGQIKDLTGKPALDEDGVAGEKTWKVFQFWAFNVRPDVVAHYAPGWGIWDFTDGIDGVKTWQVLQHMLNESYANSGKLLKR